MTPEKIKEALNTITKTANLISHGDYNAAKTLSIYTKTKEYPEEISALAEEFGMMAVKLEAEEVKLQKGINCIIKYSKLISNGDYESCDELYEYTNSNLYPKNVSELAECFGLMAVKLEAREFKLEKTIEELQQKQEELEKAIKMREEFTFVFINAIMMVSLYTFIVVLLNSDLKIPEYVSRILEISIFVFTYFWIKKTKIPLINFGLTIKNWFKSIWESMAVTATLMGSVALGKYICMHFNMGFSKNEPFIHTEYLNWIFGAYIFVAVFQEFLARGVVQSSIKRVMVGTNSTFWAIILAAMLFGMFHIHMSIYLGILSILASFMWGALFERHKTIIGISISHFLVGNWLVLLGYWDLLKK